MARQVLEVKAFGVEESAARLDMMARRARNASPAMARIMHVFEESEEALWDRHTGWAPLAPATVARKGNSNILEDTGKLRASLTEHGTGAIREIGPHEAKFGTRVWYSVFAGGTKKGEPKRQLIKLRPKDRAEIAHIIERFLVGKLG